MRIICISGKAGAGKDTFGEFMKEAAEAEGYRVLIAHYADLVKYVCKTFFGWDGVKDVEGRTLLQSVGTDTVRRQNPDFWVNFIISMLRFFPDRWDFVILPDLRFENEYSRFVEEEFDVYSVRIMRGRFQTALTNTQLEHISETALDDYDFDYIVHNDGSEEELKQTAIEFVRGFKFTDSVCN